MTGTAPPRLTRGQVAFLALLVLHGTGWLAAMIVQPSIRTGAICLSSYLAVLAALALLLSGRQAVGGKRRRRCGDCDTWNGPDDGECIVCGGNRWQAAPATDRRDT